MKIRPVGALLYHSDGDGVCESGYKCVYRKLGEVLPFLFNHTRDFILNNSSVTVAKILVAKELNH
jgi:hypothetical protein